MRETRIHCQTAADDYVDITVLTSLFEIDVVQTDTAAVVHLDLSGAHELARALIDFIRQHPATLAADEVTK